jgi:penicillin-binding protein 1A
VKRTFQKFQEWIISAQLERQYTKDEIIAMYLNRFDWINQAVGINSAARVYFSTTPDSLKVEEAALLVGMCKNPALFNPCAGRTPRSPAAWWCLDQMRKNGFLSTTQYDSLKVLPIGLKFQKVDHAEGPAPYFREVLRAKLQAMLNEKDEDRQLRFAKADGSALRHLHRRPEASTPPRTAACRSMGSGPVREHLGTELQPSSSRTSRKKKNKPFDFRVTKEEIAGILNTAMKRSVRYKNLLTGKQCRQLRAARRYIETKQVRRVANTSTAGLTRVDATHTGLW